MRLAAQQEEEASLTAELEAVELNNKVDENIFIARIIYII